MPTGAVDARLLAEIDRLATREVTETRVPGLAIGLTAPTGPPTIRAWGLADVAADRPVEPDTLFEIGSIGKTFTAIAILQLVAEGRLELHAPVAEALPWFEVPVVGRPITIHDLLTHTAGITSGIDGTPEAAFQVWSLRHRRPGSAPGERFHYSNVGYKALGLVIEAVEGRPFAEVIQARVLEPLGMTATEPAITHGIRPRLAVGYDYLHDDRIGYPGRPIAPATWLETATADGSIASTAGDMTAFARMLLRRGEGPDGRILDEASFSAMAEPHIVTPRGLSYGYGLGTRVVRGRTLVGHAGGMVGYLSALQVDPVAGLALIVLENGLMGRPMELARAILTPEVGSVADGAAGPDAEPNRSGVYRADTDALEIVDGPGGPILRRDGLSLALEAFPGGRFLAPDPSLDRYALRFDPPDGPPNAVWHGPRRFVREGVSLPHLAAPEPVVAALAGHYRSHNPWTTNFRVVLRGTVPWLLFVAAPDGFEDEQPLVARPDGSFRVGEDLAGPEDLRFDSVLDGRPLRAWLSGCAYYRVG